MSQYERRRKTEDGRATDANVNMADDTYII